MSIIDLYDLFIHNPQITTDSRNCPKGSIFFALKGDKFDGNQYAGKALASGCVYAVIDNPDYYIGERTILVDNVLKTLQQLAHHRANQYPGDQSIFIRSDRIEQFRIPVLCPLSPAEYGA